MPNNIPQKSRLILSLDGGGIRGAIPAAFLAGLERDLGVPLASKFDLIAGTSTGGILACAIGAGIPAENIVRMYEYHGAEIFNRQWYRPQAFLPKYSASGIDQILTQTFGSRLFAEAKTKLLVPAYDMKTSQPAHFKSWEDRDSQTFAGVARATSAAPTYFPAAQDRYLDGGLFANDPAMNAYAEAKCLWPNEPIKILSIGTGHAAAHSKIINNGGLLAWGIGPAMEILLNVSSPDVEYMAKACLGDQYLRIEKHADGASDHMDDASHGNIAALKSFGDSLYLSELDRVRVFVKW